jgi:methyl-accepting chemotaxis protein
LLNQARQHELNNVIKIINKEIVLQSKKASAIVSFVTKMPLVIRAFREKNREKLVEILQPILNEQKNKFGVQDAQFHLPPAISFLRVFEPDKGYGDDISFRSLVLRANKNNESLEGVEIGREGLSIRSIGVVNDLQGSIGTFEIGMNFSSLLRDIKALTNIDITVFVNKDLMQKIATLVPPASSDEIISGMQMIDSTNWKTTRSVLDAEKLTAINDVVFHQFSLNQSDYGVILIPLLDFQGNDIGVIAAVSSFDKYQSMYNRTLIQTIIFAILQAILMIGVVLILINGCLLKPFNFLNAKLSDLANGEKEVDVAELKKLNDEIGLMAKSIDMINEKLHPKLAKKGSSQKQKIKTADIVVQPKKNKSKIDVSSTQKLSVDDMNTNPEDE